MGAIVRVLGSAVLLLAVLTGTALAKKTFDEEREIAKRLGLKM